MIIILGIGVATTFAVFYLGKKGWQALHKAVGITPGLLTYQDPNAPLLLADITWQKLTFNEQHLRVLSGSQLCQLQRIDKKVATYYNDQQSLQAQSRTPAVDEAQFVLHKLLYIRLPEILASHYYVINSASNNNTKVSADDNTKGTEARQLLQEVLDNIDWRLDKLFAQIETRHLQHLQVMKRYLDSHN